MEAYLYGLFLDQGFDAVARWFCPILVKKLYAEAANIGIKLPRPIYAPIEDNRDAQPLVLSDPKKGMMAKLKALGQSTESAQPQVLADQQCITQS